MERDREMFKAKCSECGEDCEVPFKPREGGQVKCQKCFKKKEFKRPGGDRFGAPRGGRFGSSRGGDRFGSSRGGDRFGSSRGGDRFGAPREDHKIKCASCGIDTTVPFRPTQGKPVFCKECYSKKG